MKKALVRKPTVGNRLQRATHAAAIATTVSPNTARSGPTQMQSCRKTTASADRPRRSASARVIARRRRPVAAGSSQAPEHFRRRRRSSARVGKTRPHQRWTVAGRIESSVGDHEAPFGRTRKRAGLGTRRRLQLRQRTDLHADAGGLGGRVDHFAGRRIANKRAGASRRDLAQSDLEKAGQDEFADAPRMDGAEEEVLQRRVDAGGGLPRDFVLFRDEIDQRRFGQDLLDRLDRWGSSLRSLLDRSFPGSVANLAGGGIPGIWTPVG